MKEHGWNVKEHHHLETAWEATFEHGQGGRVIGVNSEVSRSLFQLFGQDNYLILSLRWTPSKELDMPVVTI
jgi:hypothetical protein